VNGQYDPPVVSFAIFAPSRLCGEVFRLISWCVAEIFTAKAQRSQRFAKKIKALREQHLSSIATHRVNGQYDPSVVSFAIFAPSRLCGEVFRLIS